MNNHKYVSVADFNAPFDGAHYLQGLGNAHAPAGRSYWSTANFRAPYDHGYFQDNTLMGLGSVKEDIFVVLRQVPTWAYIVGGLGFSYLAYKSYNAKKEK
jgi:hypothetical protein